MRKQETMRRTIHKDGLALLQHSEQAPSGVITEAQVLGLPEPLQRYLHYAQVVGKASIRTVRLTQHGFMRMQPDQKWLPMIAQQYFTTAPPAFLWNTTIQPFPLVSISASPMATIACASSHPDGQCAWTRNGPGGVAALLA